MSEIKRYSFDLEYNEIMTGKNCEYVLYADHVARVGELQNRIECWQIKNDTLNWPKVEARITELESENKSIADRLIASRLEAADRIAVLQAKLNKAVAALNKFQDYTFMAKIWVPPHHQKHLTETVDLATKTLAEITKGAE